MASLPLSPGEKTLSRLLFRERLIPESAVNACALGRAYLQQGQTDKVEHWYGIALKRLQEQIAAGQHESALLTEARIYESFVKQIEAEENYQGRFADWVTDMTRLGAAQKIEPSESGEIGNRVGFILSHGHVLGHTEALANVLRHCPEGTLQAARPVIYILVGEVSPELAAKLHGLPVEICLLAYESSQSNLEWRDRFSLLKNRIAMDGVGCCVWVATPVWAAFAFGMRIAPVQAYWTLKFHQDLGPEADICITYGSALDSETKIFAQRAWQVAPVPLSIESRPTDPAQVAATRQRFPVRHLLGTLAREEKMFVPEFLDAVVTLLRNTPDAGFAWTGRLQHPGIQQHFERAGVANRCFFIGWVDTALFARVLDIFLETFPFGCGITGYQALAAGTPLLSYAAPETIFGMHYWPVYSLPSSPPDQPFRSLVLFARTPADYISLAQRLISDTAFRKETGKLGLEFVEQEKKAAPGYARRFFDICLSALKLRGKS